MQNSIRIILFLGQVSAEFCMFFPRIAIPGANPCRSDPRLPVSGQMTPVAAAAVRNRRCMMTRQFGTGGRRGAIVTRAGRIDHHERLLARRHPGLESFRLFLPRSCHRPPGDFRGGTAKPFRNVNHGEDDELAHGGMNKLGGCTAAHLGTLTAAEFHVAPKSPYAIVPTVTIGVSVAIGKKVLELRATQGYKGMIRRGGKPASDRSFFPSFQQNP